MPNWSTAQKCLSTIRAGDTVEWYRGENRRKINNNANCFPPLDPDTAKSIGLKINVNWGEMMDLLAQARRQYMLAFWSNQHFFKVTFPMAPQEVQSEWGAFVTETINRPMKNSLEYFELHRSKWAAVACHGIGPQTWYKSDHWLPDFLAIADLRIATDTTCDFKNLSWWAVRKSYTVMELVDTVFDGKPKNKWNRKAIAKILKSYWNLNFQDATLNYDWETNPEKMADIVKQNGGFYGSDASPSITLWRFFFEDFDKSGNKRIFLRVVPDNASMRESGEEVFLWESDSPVSDSRKNLMHCQFGDLNNDSPFMYHSVRSLGFALMEPTYYTNITRCRLLQHIHDNFNVWLRITDPAEKARAQMQQFSNYSVLKSGVGVVPQTERHQIDPQLFDRGMNELKQIQQSASSSYTQRTDTGTQKEQTAFETRVKLEQVNSMMSGLLLNAFMYEKHAYMEIMRRFCLKKTTDPDIILFQKRWDQMKIPRKWMNVELMDIEPVTPLGMGNPTMAATEAAQLMENRGAYEPEAQQDILHEYTLVTTQDWRKAKKWAPIGQKKGPGSAQKFAEADFNILMRGIPAQIMEGENPLGQIETMLGLLAGEITAVMQSGGVGDAREIIGLKAVNQHIGQLLQIVSQDEANKARVTQYAKALGKLMNEVKGMEQRLAQAQKKQGQNGDDGEHAKNAAILATTQAKLHAKAMTDKQKLKQKEESFVSEQRRKDAGAFAEIQRLGVKNKMQAMNGHKKPTE